jgi:branched-chain amino acid transport system substrate-binding protein
VGDDLHPLGKIKDFSPYVSKIRASGADTVITGNWGPDLSLLIKAGRELGLDVRYYAPYAYLDGTPSAIGAAGADRVKTLTQWHANVAGNTLEDFANRFKARFKRDFMWLPGRLAVLMLVKAIEQAGSTEPAKIALALEGMRFAGPTGEVWMRADDHQLFQPLYLATFSRAGTNGVRYDLENTGFGWRTDRRFESADTVVPTTCRMERPAP